MLKMFFILFIFLSFFELIQNDDDECYKEPSSRNDCFTISNSTYYCCYKEKKCILIPKNDSKSIQEADCGISEDNYGKYEFGQYHPSQSQFDLDLGFQTCGKSNPKKKEDCSDYSDLSNSCCFFTYDGKNACFGIGRKFIKGEENKFTFDNKEVSYECNSFNIIFRLYLIILYIFF